MEKKGDPLQAVFNLSPLTMLSDGFRSWPVHNSLEVLTDRCDRDDL